MLEFHIKEVWLMNCAGAYIKMKISELLPVGFGPEVLEK